MIFHLTRLGRFWIDSIDSIDQLRGLPKGQGSRPEGSRAGWRKYSGLVLCKSRGNYGVTASTSCHWKPQESSVWRWFHSASQCHMGLAVTLPGCDGALFWGVGLAGYRFLCAGKYIAPLIEHEWGRPQHPAHEGVTSPGSCSCSWLGECKGSWMVGYLSSCPGCAVTRHLE